MGLSQMVGIHRLKYLVEDRDRHGNPRIYVRLPGKSKARIKGIPGSKEFMDAYHAALAGDVAPAKASRKPSVIGSFRKLCELYYASPEYRGLDISTRSWRMRSLDKICEKDGAKPYALMQPVHIRKLRDDLAAQPGAANNRLKALKALFSWAVEAHQADFNPAHQIKLIRYKTEGHHSWTPDDIEAFEKKHPLGTKPRLAFALLLYTACRREDATRLGPQHIKNGRLKYTQGKNEDRSPVTVDIPVHPNLAKIIAATPSGHLTFLVTEYGKQHSVAGFGNRFREWCDNAGLKHCSAHGLRKATAAHLADLGCSAHEIMAITGHKSLAEVERYTKAAEMTKLADRAMARFSGSEA